MKAINSNKIEKLLNALYRTNVPFHFEQNYPERATLLFRMAGKNDLNINISAKTKIAEVLEKVSSYFLIPNIPQLVITDDPRIDNKKPEAVNTNAIDLLIQLTQKRNWHQGKLDRKVASFTKKNVALGKVSYEKAVEILQLLGYQKIQEETWHAP